MKRAHRATKRPDFIYVFSSAMAQYVPRDLPARTRILLDFVDVDFREVAAIRRDAVAQSALVLPDRGQSAAEIRPRARRRGRTPSIFVSEDEKRIFDRLSPGTKAQACRDRQWRRPCLLRSGRRDGAPPVDGKAIVFVGMMDYWPNIDAVTWFAKEILPLVRAKHADALFQIVGARPTPAVTALAALTGVEVTGAVPDVRPYVAGRRGRCRAVAHRARHSEQGSGRHGDGAADGDDAGRARRHQRGRGA